MRAVESPARTVLAYLRERQPEMTSLLRDLALLESPSHDAASQEPVFVRIAAELAEAGLRSRRLRGRQTGGQLWAARRQRKHGAPVQLLLGHSDTVWPLGTAAR